MVKKSDALNHVPSHRWKFQPLLHSCLLLLFGFLLSWNSSSAFAGANGAPSAQGTLLTARDAFHGHTVPLPLPSKSRPVPQGQEFPDENEAGEDTDDDGNLFAGLQASEQACRILFSASSFFTASSSFDNRPTVPFFILYHSWKSFLS